MVGTATGRRRRAAVARSPGLPARGEAPVDVRPLDVEELRRAHHLGHLADQAHRQAHGLPAIPGRAARSSAVSPGSSGRIMARHTRAMGDGTVWAIEGAPNPTVLRVHVGWCLTDRTIVSCPPGPAPAPFDGFLEIDGVRSIDLHPYRVRVNLSPGGGRGSVSSPRRFLAACGPGAALGTEPLPRAFAHPYAGARGWRRARRWPSIGGAGRGVALRGDGGGRGRAGPGVGRADRRLFDWDAVGPASPRRWLSRSRAAGHRGVALGIRRGASVDTSPPESEPDTSWRTPPRTPSGPGRTARRRCGARTGRCSGGIGSPSGTRRRPPRWRRRCPRDARCPGRPRGTTSCTTPVTPPKCCSMWASSWIGSRRTPPAESGSGHCPWSAVTISANSPGNRSSSIATSRPSCSSTASSSDRSTWGPCCRRGPCSRATCS